MDTTATEPPLIAWCWAAQRLALGVPAFLIECGFGLGRGTLLPRLAADADLAGLLAHFQEQQLVPWGVRMKRLGEMLLSTTELVLSTGEPDGYGWAFRELRQGWSAMGEPCEEKGSCARRSCEGRAARGGRSRHGRAAAR